MRLLQLNPEGDDETALDFHPTFTVVTGLGAAGRERLVQAIAALPAGRDPGCAGLVEAHGVLFDLTSDTLAMFDLATEREVLVRAADLPAVGSASTAAPSVGAAALTIEQVLASTPPGKHPDLDALRRRQEEAREALDLLREACARTRADYEEVAAKRRQAQIALDAATAAAEAADEGATLDELSQVEINLRRSDLEDEIGGFEQELARIDRGLEELSGIDTRPIQVLLDAIREPAPTELVPSDEAAGLADEFVALQSKVTKLEDALEARGLGPATAMQRLEEARGQLQRAEQAMAKPDLSPDDVAELEAAHEEVLEAERRISGFGRRGGQKRLDEALEREQSVLDRVGFPTWSSYVMGAGLLAIDPVAEERLEKARFEFEAAEAGWADVTAMIEADPEHRALLDQLEAVYLAAYDLLGGEEPEDLEGALRSLRVPKREVSTEELVDALAYQLELVGLDLGADSPGLDYTVMVADAFLAEAVGINERISELHDERGTIMGRLDASRAALAALAEEPLIDLTDTAAGAGSPDPGSDEELARLGAALAEAIEDENDHREALEARDALVDAATQVEAVATSRLIKLATDLAEAEGSAAASPPPEAASGDGPEGDGGAEAIEFYLLARLIALRNVSFAGSVPLVLDDALAGIAGDELDWLLGKVERMAETVQVIYLTDSPDVVDWTTRAGFARAAVVPAPAPFV